MKVILYLIVLLVFLLPSGARLEPAGMPPMYAMRDTIPGASLQLDSNTLITDSLVIVVDSLSSADTFALTGKAIKGVASYYSKKFEGRKTATGAIFRHAKLTGASNHFKLNTVVKVTNLKNNKSVIVVINDRMHARMKKKGRVIDLSKNAANELDFVKSGLTKVVVQPLSPYTKK